MEKGPVLTNPPPTTKSYQKDVLHISELAAFTGHNTYVSSEEAMAKIWKRLRPKQYKQAVTRNRATVQTHEEVVSDLQINVASIVNDTCEQAATKKVRKLVQETPLVQATTDTIQQIQNMLINADVLPEQKVVQLVRMIETPGKKLTDEAKLNLVSKASDLISQSGKKRKAVSQQAITEFIQSTKIEDCAVSKASVQAVVNKQRGTRNESPAIALYEKETGDTVTGNNSKFYLCNIGSAEAPCHIGGYVDGLVNDSKIVEVKCRRNRFFKWLPVYEKIQIMSYMHVVGRTRCDWVQYYNGQIRIDTHEFDEDYWYLVRKEILKKWNEFLELCTNQLKQDQLLSVLK